MLFIVNIPKSLLMPNMAESYIFGTMHHKFSKPKRLYFERYRKTRLVSAVTDGFVIPLPVVPYSPSYVNEQAHCAVEDKFDMVKGDKLVLSRLLERMNFTKTLREFIWAYYREVESKYNA